VNVGDFRRIVHPSRSKVMNNLETARNHVMATLIKHGVEMQEVDRSRMVDEYGNLGNRKYADDSLFFCDRADLRLVFRDCSDDGEIWFELELGCVHDRADSDSAHPIMLRYSTGAGSDERWLLSRYESQESLALLERVDQRAARLLERRPSLTPYIREDQMHDPNSPFFLALVDKLVAKFAAAA